jgi:hypothetical protein
MTRSSLASFEKKKNKKVKKKFFFHAYGSKQFNYGEEVENTG